MTDDCIENYTYLFDRNLLKGKVALITGGGSGIGFTITEIFMRHGCDAVIVSRDIKKLSTAAEKLSKATGRKCLAVVADVRKGQEVLAALDQALAEFNHIDIVVNCAAGNFLCPLSNMSFNAFKVVMEIDAQGTFNVSKAAYEKYLRDNGGVILNITATLYYRGNVLQAHAGAAKAAVDALTKHMATEWGSNGIRVVGLAPGAIANTVGFNKLGGAALSDSIKSGIPLNRFGTRLEIAEAALFLVADTARYVTGETLIVDGGAWMTFGVGMDHGMQRIGAVQSTSKL